MKTVTKTEESLTASKGLPGQLDPAAFLLALGVLLTLVPEGPWIVSNRRLR